MASQSLPFLETSFPIRRVEKDIQLVYNVRDRRRGKSNTTTIDINEETDDFKFGSMILFLIFEWTRYEIPKMKELDLLSRTRSSVKGNQVISEVPSEKVVHIHMKTSDMVLMDGNPTD